MATLANVTLEPKRVSPNSPNVSLHLTYTLTPSTVEKQAGTVFREHIEILGEDGAVDPLLVALSDQTFPVSTTTASVARTRDRTVSKSIINEDPGVDTRASELGDELLAKVTVTYAANAPIPTPVIPPAFSAVVRGVWK